MPPVGQCQGRRNSADEGREGALRVGHLLGLQLPQEFGRTGLGRAKRAGELGGGEGAKAEQQHPCMIEARIRTLVSAAKVYDNLVYALSINRLG